MVRLQHFYHLGELRLAVLDDMSLVEDAIIPMFGEEEFAIVAYDVVRSHHQVVIAQEGL